MDRRRKPAIREPRPEITLEEMRAILENITEIESATGRRILREIEEAKEILKTKPQQQARAVPAIRKQAKAVSVIRKQG